MPTGFIYVVTSLRSDYTQKRFCSVPTEWEGRLYFGPCKSPMRSRIRVGDYIFGVSRSGLKPRRIVFAARVEQRLSFREAYERFPDLRGPEGPIHVRPVNREQLPFPENQYKLIDGAMHCGKWKQDLKTSALDAFFVCYPKEVWLGAWLGEFGPDVDDKVLDLLRTCSVHGEAGRLSDSNPSATIHYPVAYGKLYTGLHLETNSPQKLIDWCDIRISSRLAGLEGVQGTPPKGKGTRRHSCS